MTKILLVDDRAVVRKGLRYILESSPESWTINEADSAQQALKLIRAETPDAVILDISLPDRNGIEVLKLIKNEQPSLPVLMLSVYPEEQYGVRVLKAGAAGLLDKASAPERLLEAIRTLLKGQKYIGATMAQKLLGELTGGQTQQPLYKLTDREYQIFCLLGAGKSVAEIAAQLHLSIKTVYTHRIRLLNKMDLKSNAELILYAARHQLLDGSEPSD